ncbi:WD40 repeat-like protein [Coniophora puteana RWD-64-598 SS2]|uniref:WD40 repeat-like protein n=1 Tax=Coniophora puteana (strain RWD-64-598) TaxID=741705 RepID=A0A5M3N0G3_CONPW|nr:WD40 repeat-like protein [Coniophora puteana RWD-64-598 SS2]EIW84872.1 WD40 repeat-like protein [Coniophora puteana RWD-64-598 SS2]
MSDRDVEALTYQLLGRLPRSKLADIQRRIDPMLRFDLISHLPTELALKVFSCLPAPDLLACGRVCRRWRAVADDQALWRALCAARGWRWRSNGVLSDSKAKRRSASLTGAGGGEGARRREREDGDEDEGMGDEEEDDESESEDEGMGMGERLDGHVGAGAGAAQDESADSGFQSMVNGSMDVMRVGEREDAFRVHSPQAISPARSTASDATIVLSATPTPARRTVSAGPSLSRLPIRLAPSSSSSRPSVPAAPTPLAPDYKLLHRTHTLLHARVRRGAYRLRTLPGPSGGGHTAAVYCLALWTYPAHFQSRTQRAPRFNNGSGSRSGEPLQVLFTGSKDRTVREWDVRTGRLRRVIAGRHSSSVLSLCVAPSRSQVGTEDGEDDGTDELGDAGLLVTGGSDRLVTVWDLGKDRLVKALRDHLDSVLCVRVDGGRLVTCSKDRTVRTYAFPSLQAQFVLEGHRAAVNAVSVVGDTIISGSGDRSVRVWDARTGELVQSFEDHHSRGIASIEFHPPFLLSGSSDRHVRMFDISTSQGWSTSHRYDTAAQAAVAPQMGAAPYASAAMANAALAGASATSTMAAGGSFMQGVQLHGSLSQTLLQGSVGLDAAGADFGHPVAAPNSTVTLGHHNYTHNGGVGVGAAQQPQTVLMQCGSCRARAVTAIPIRAYERHGQLVRSVALGDEFAITGSYDLSIKVWDRKTGALVADLVEGHVGRIFCVGFDGAKIVSCGEDQRVCIWDFSHGMDTSFIEL